MFIEFWFDPNFFLLVFGITHFLIIEEPNSRKCEFADSIKSLSNDKLQLTPETINKDHFCKIHNYFDVTFENDP